MKDKSIEPDPPAYVEGFLEQDYGKVLKSLEQDPAQARLVFGEIKTTLLHAAAYDGQCAIVERLIGLGANVDARESNGRTPLHHAANNGHLEVIELLVRSGADIEARDVEGITPLMWGRISRTGRKSEIAAKLLSLGAENDE